eukprot:TRINITY_DN23380_c0_g1_i1.p1 TRINITY_DN23380_c0_g1~~TRINITY_DN23380_c0_g1_i1.p1  ORF type:complete len:454 (-),score=109.05 TRINITY_DN23380_c0_g1_i1:525-1886(-)
MTTATLPASADSSERKAAVEQQQTGAVEKAAGATDKPTAVVKKTSKPRIDCIDGCRFALIFPIVVAHFIKYGTSRPFLLKLLTQENVLVGGFFVISGYVTGYTSTNLRELSVDKKRLAWPELFFWQKVMGYYPLHFIISTMFAPMFIAVDRWYKNPWSTTRFHACLNYSLMQAWFPSEAEIWNPPTWFLSALTFGNFAMPTFVLPPVAGLSKDGLKKLVAGLGCMSLLQKLSYSQAWQYQCRGNWVCQPSQPYLWNSTRFHPVWALVELTMGIAAAREVMLDEPINTQEAPKLRNPLWLFLASYATLGLRLSSRLNFNDALIRSGMFIPLYLKFLQTIHRDCLTASPHMITRFFGSKTLTWLGSLAFPMFLLHGPIGQLFYKKAIATRLWGRIMPHSFFPAYLAIVMIASHIVNEGVVKNKTVSKIAAAVAQFLAKRTNGMLQDVTKEHGGKA